MTTNKIVQIVYIALIAIIGGFRGAYVNVAKSDLRVTALHFTPL